MLKKILIASAGSFMAVIFFCGIASSAEKSDIKAGNRTAYIIIDIQNDYFPGGKLELLNSAKAAENAKNVLSYMRKKKIDIIHIRHENEGSKATFFIPGTTGAEIHSSVTPLKNEPVFLKHKPSSFIGTALEEELKKNGITHLVISGMQSNVCVQSTTLEALTKGYTVTVLKDSIAAKNEELHKKAVSEMKEQGAEIALSSDIMK
jgi:nicotinamidase-related amidase